MAALDVPSHRTPKFRHGPWSQADYVQRARSIHWNWPIPFPADVPSCARYGWCQSSTNPDPNTLYCLACRAKLYLPWDEELIPEARQMFVEEYHLKLETGHVGGCPWRVTPCHEDLMKVSFISRTVEMEACQERCQSWANLSEISIFIGDERLEKLIQASKHYFSGEIHTGALLLSLLQWRNFDESVACIHGCCELPLECLKDSFDPVAAHAWFCPLVYCKDGTNRPSWNLLVDLWTAPDGRVLDVQSLSPLLSQFTCSRIKEVLRL